MRSLEQKREYNRQYMRERAVRLQRMCACGSPMSHRAKQCRSCANRDLRRHAGNWSFALMLEHHPEKSARYCHRCGYGYDAYIPRYADTDHCTWCVEEIERGGRMVIGAGIAAMGGWIQVPGTVMDETTDKDEYNRRYREKQAVKKRCACGRPIDVRSRHCARCAAKAFQETVHTEERETA